ncbi:MAG: hypothetical protein AAFQ42_02900 [Pseudomonadota bacterium]
MPVRKNAVLVTAGLAGVVIAAAMVTASTPASAKIVKYCQGGNHMHYGSGSGPTKRAARRAAIASWSGFTVFEYGSAWGRFSNARLRRTSCAKSGTAWSCSVEGNPCRRAR